jgi:RNA polymerase subunit RPABC4/transcription elongation factor Spt4
VFRVLLFQIAAGLLGGYIARSKGRNPFLWGLLCFILPLLVLAILVLPARETRGLTKRCPNCSGIVSRNETVCPHCKKELPIDLVRCEKCGSFVPETEICPQCRQKVKS